jgi:hypothetical protein
MANVTILTGTLEKTTLGKAAVESKPVVEVDVARHGGEDAPAEPPPKPTLGGAYELDEAVLDGELPIDT